MNANTLLPAHVAKLRGLSVLLNAKGRPIAMRSSHRAVTPLDPHDFAALSRESAGVIGWVSVIPEGASPEERLRIGLRVLHTWKLCLPADGGDLLVEDRVRLRALKKAHARREAAWMAMLKGGQMQAA